MECKISIRMDNAAFEDDGSAGYPEPARILSVLSGELRKGRVPSRLMDYNGNTVGFLEKK